jgi:hypothetical protein
LTSITSCQDCSVSSSGAAEVDDAGVGDHHVEPAQSGDPVVDYCLQRGVVADVGLVGDDAAVEGLDLLDRLVRVVVRRNVDGDDVGALFGQPDGVAAALTPRGAGDEGDFSC